MGIIELLAVLPLQLHPGGLADPVPVLVDGREPRGRPVLAAPGVAEGVDADHGGAVVQTTAGVALGLGVYIDCATDSTPIGRDVMRNGYKLPFIVTRSVQ